MDFDDMLRKSREESARMRREQMYEAHVMAMAESEARKIANRVCDEYEPMQIVNLLKSIDERLGRLVDRLN